MPDSLPLNSVNLKEGNSSLRLLVVRLSSEHETSMSRGMAYKRMISSEFHLGNLRKSKI